MMGTGCRSAVGVRAFMLGCRRRWISWVGRIGNGSAWLISSELDVGKTDTSDKGAVVPGRNSGLGQGASDGRDPE